MAFWVVTSLIKLQQSAQKLSLIYNFLGFSDYNHRHINIYYFIYCYTDYNVWWKQTLWPYTWFCCHHAVEWWNCNNLGYNSCASLLLTPPDSPRPPPQIRFDRCGRGEGWWGRGWGGWGEGRWGWQQMRLFLTSHSNPGTPREGRGGRGRGGGGEISEAGRLFLSPAQSRTGQQRTVSRGKGSIVWSVVWSIRWI